MRKIVSYILIIATVIIYASCFNAQKINKKITREKEYKGWVIGTAFEIFFVIDRKGFFRKDIAFGFGGFPRLCPGRDEIFAAFFKQPCNDRQGSIILNRDDSTSLGRTASIYPAKVFYKDFDTTFMAEARSKYGKLLHKIRAKDGKRSIKAIWVNGFAGFAELQDLVLFSNCNTDTLNYFACPGRKKQ